MVAFTGMHRASAWAAVSVFLFTWTLTTHGKYSATGDEPHYLMIAHSLAVDGDLDVANNYADNHGRFFGHDHLEMGLHAVPARDGHVRPIHNVGLAVALVPVYVVARQVARIPSDAILARMRMNRGLFVYSIVSLFLIGLTATGLYLLAGGLAAVTGSPAAALAVAVAGISPPIVSHAFLVFPDTVGLFVTCLVVGFVLKPPAPGDRVVLLAVLFAAGVLPWMHNKYLLYGPGLLFVLWWKRRSVFLAFTPAQRVLAGSLFAVPPAVLLLWTWREWGTLGGALTTDGLPFSVSMLSNGLPGLFFDRQSGLLAYAPLYWIVPACWYLTRRTTAGFLVPAALLYLPAAAFTTGWWAGFSPAARYLVPLMPFAVVVVAEALRYRAVRFAALVLLLPQLLIDVLAWQHPRTLWPSADGNAVLHMLGAAGRLYETLLPDLRGGASPAGVLGPTALVTVVSGILIALAHGAEPGAGAERRTST